MCGKDFVSETWLVLRVVSMWYGKIFCAFVGGRVQSVPLGRLGGESFSASRVSVAIVGVAVGLWVGYVGCRIGFWLQDCRLVAGL